MVYLRLMKRHLETDEQMPQAIRLDVRAAFVPPEFAR